MYEPLDDEEFQNPDYFHAQKGGGVMISISIEYQMYLSKYRYSEQSLKYMQKFVLIHLNDFLEKVRVNV